MSARCGLSLDDTVAQRLGSLPSSWGPITLRQLLQHTSGLANYTAAPAWLQQLGRNPGAYLTPRELIAFVAGAPLNFAPGTHYEYSNTDNLVVGLMVEQAASGSYEGQLGAQVLGPLRLRGTSLPSTFLMPSPFVHGYDPQPRGRYQDVSEVVNSAQIWAAGGMVSTPADLNTFARAYGGPRLLSASTRAAQRTLVAGSSEPPGPGTNDAGLAIFRYRTRCGAVFDHTGNFPGYTQFFAATPDGTRSIAVTANEQLDIAAASRPKVFRYLRAAFEAGVCAALAR